MKATRKQIDNFFSAGVMAIVGVSRNEKKFGRMIFNDLKKHGYQLIPVNRNMEEINGQTCYKNLRDIPEEVDSALIISPKSETNNILKDALEIGIKNIWIQKESCNKETMQIAESAEQNVIHSACVYMHAPPVKGIHKFHRSIVGLFGGLPK